MMASLGPRCPGLWLARKNTRALSPVPAKVGIISSAGTLLAPNQSPGLGRETLRL